MDAKDFVIPGGRSFFLAFSTLLIVSGLVAYDLIADGVYSAIILGTVGAYIARAVADDYMANKNGKKPPSTDLPEGIKP